MNKSIRIAILSACGLVLSAGAARSADSSSAQTVADIQAEVAKYKHIAQVLTNAANKKTADAASFEAQAQQITGQAEEAGQAQINAAQQQASNAQSNAQLLSAGSQLAQMFGAPSWLTNGLQTASNVSSQSAANAQAGVGGTEAQAQQAVYEAQKQAAPLQAKADRLRAEAKKLTDAVAAINALANARLMLALAYDLHDKIGQDAVAVSRLEADLSGALK